MEPGDLMLYESATSPPRVHQLESNRRPVSAGITFPPIHYIPSHPVLRIPSLPVPSHPAPSPPIPPNPNPCYPNPIHRIASHRIASHRTPPCPVPTPSSRSRPVPSHPTPPHPIPSRPIPPHPVRSCMAGGGSRCWVMSLPIYFSIFVLPTGYPRFEKNSVPTGRGGSILSGASAGT